MRHFDLHRGQILGTMTDSNAKIRRCTGPYPIRGNIHSISGDYWFDAAKNRSIAVHPAIIREALDKVYHAKSMLAEREEK